MDGPQHHAQRMDLSFQSVIRIFLSNLGWIVARSTAEGEINRIKKEKTQKTEKQTLTETSVYYCTSLLS